MTPLAWYLLAATMLQLTILVGSLLRDHRRRLHVAQLETALATAETALATAREELDALTELREVARVTCPQCGASGVIQVSVTRDDQLPPAKGVH